MLAPVGGRWGEGARCRRETPFLDVRFDENEAKLAEVNMDRGGTIGADGREEVQGFEAVCGVVKFFAVAREEDGACAWTVADADDVTLVEGGRVRGTIERLIVAALAKGRVGDRVFVPA